MVKLNLIGTKFGKLLVIRKTEERKSYSPVWECLCDCGNTAYVTSRHLRDKTTVSCGCHRRYVNRLDLSGKKFNKLTVIERINDSGIIWLCKCDCGNITTANTSDLTCNHKKSCGCLLKYDLIGQKFGKLTVVGLHNKKNDHLRRWDCICECGNTTFTTTNSLMCGRTKSCGCIKKETSAINGKKCKIYHKYGTPFRHIINNYKKRAESKNLEFELTDEQFYELNKNNCYYCGIEPTHTLTYRGEKYTYNGIDRINSSVGYTVENSVSCCSMCNYAKRDASIEDFMAWIERFKNR